MERPASRRWAMSAVLSLVAFGCGAEPNPSVDPQSGKRDEVSREKCGVDWLEGALPAGTIEGKLTSATCPRNAGASEPYACAIVLQNDKGSTGLLLKTGVIDPVEVEPQLKCLLSSRVAVRTTGLLESSESQELTALVSAPLTTELRWGGEIHRRAEVAECAPTLEGALPAGTIEGKLTLATCPRNAGASEPYTCAIVLENDQGSVGLLLKTGVIDPVDVEPQLKCLLGSRVAVRTTGLLESSESQELKALISSPLNTELRWGGEIYQRAAQSGNK